METLKIKNFLCIAEAQIEIKKINLFIGEQAQGKSIIAKLIYFFKEYPTSILTAIYSKKKNKAEFDNELIAIFEKIFPRYTWGETEFSINYSNKYYSVSVDNRKSENNTFNFSLSNSENFDNAFLSVIPKKRDRNFLKQDDLDSRKLRKKVLDLLFFENKNCYIENIIYIPAGRSFFANLQKNFFSLIDNIQLDFFLKEFGRVYEFLKNLEGIGIFIEHGKYSRITHLVEQLIGGELRENAGQDWIINDKNKIAVVNASSGQQEVLPIAIILSKHHTFETSKYSTHFIIEEPEAHLFPIAQSAVVSLIALVYNDITRHGEWNFDPETEEEFLDNIVLQRQNTFTITTHSPYILTAFNNLIQAGNVAASKNYQNLDELYKVVPESEIVDFNDVSAYLVNNGTVQSILNQELKLIDANMIDEASNYSSEIFGKLISMEEFDD